MFMIYIHRRWLIFSAIGLIVLQHIHPHPFVENVRKEKKWGKRLTEKGKGGEKTCMPLPNKTFTQEQQEKTLW